jgi:hypothetical protein
MSNAEIKEGSRVKVFDPRLFVDDFKTPLSMTVQPATVLRRRMSPCLDYCALPRLRYTNRFDDVVDV